MRSGKIFWAVVLIGLGFLFLISNLGILDINTWRLFWPGVLILLGIWFLIGSTTGAGEMILEDGSVDLEGAESASVTVKHGAGKLVLSGSAEEGKLVSGKFASGLDAQVQKEGSRLKVVLQPQNRAFPDIFYPGNWVSGRGLHWDFGLSKDIPLDLVFETGAVDASLDFTDLLVKNLVIKTGASSTAVKMPAAAGTTYFKVEAGAASMDIQIPDGVAVRVETESGLASISVDQNRFPKSNGIHQSPDFDSAENKVDIRIETGMASIDIH
jgi:hypothetical protein